MTFFKRLRRCDEVFSRLNRHEPIEFTGHVCRCNIESSSIRLRTRHGVWAARFENGRPMLSVWCREIQEEHAGSGDWEL